MFLPFPEFLQVMKDIKTQSAQYLLGHHSTAQDIVECGVEGLSSILRRVSCWKLGRERAQALYEVAGRSVGIEEGSTGMFLEIQEILSEIEASERFTGRVEQEISCSLQQIPYRDSLLSLKGIGEITAAGLIEEVGDSRQFHTLSEILKVAALDLFEISSGKDKGARHISKRGRPLPPKFLCFAAINAIRKGGTMYASYQRYLQRGMPGTKGSGSHCSETVEDSLCSGTRS
jgi:transposase